MKSKILLIATIICLSCNDSKERHKFNHKIMGQGEPTIVISPSMGETLEGWDSLQTALAKLSTVATYDRLGLGKSDTTSAPRTLKNLSEDLNDFLTSNNIAGPYLLIGHSLGASIVRKYQSDFSSNVLGMILIDPIHEHQFDTLMASKTSEEREKILTGRDQFLASLRPGELNEAIQYHKQIEELKAIDFSKDISITILGSFQVGKGANKEDRAIKDRLYQQWIDQAPHVKLVKTEQSGHYIHDTEPELFMNEVKLMLKSVRENNK